MKKLFIIGLSMLMLIGLTASVFATDITLSGEITVRGENNNNTTDFDSSLGDVGAWYDEKVGLRVDAKVTPRTSGVIILETDGANGYGNQVNVDEWGQNASGATGLAAGNTVTDIISIREAYIHHTGSGLLGIPAGLKIGRMQAILGRGLFFDHTLFGDQGIMLYANPIKGMQIFALTLKLDENNAIDGALAIATEVIGDGIGDDDGVCELNENCTSNGSSDDVDSYTVGFSNSFGVVNFSTDFTYVNAQDFLSYPSVTGRLVTSPLHLWNLGVRADATVGIANLYGDTEFQYGKARNNYRERNAGVREDRTFKGFAILLGGTVDVNPARLNFEFAYGTGDKRDYSVANAFDVTNFDSEADNEAFQTSLGADQQHYTYVYEDRVPAATGARSTGLTNTMYLKAGAETDVNPDLTVGGAIYYLRATNDTNVGGAMTSAGRPSPSKDLGWEIDGDLTYKLDTNLVYFVQAGYMITGNVYDTDNNDTRPNGVNLEADNAYVLRHGISLLF